MQFVLHYALLDVKVDVLVHSNGHSAKHITSKELYEHVEHCYFFVFYAVYYKKKRCKLP